MRKLFLTIAVHGSALLATAVSFAQAPASAPAGSTGLCKVGSFYSGATKQGACRGHQGVKEWYGAATAVAAAGGGAGQVWANAGTKVYHCPSDKWYGKTKEGAYISEADAKAKGFDSDHGKACQ